ncbi:MAG: PilT/PilU family type 4a pilus ATPase [Actinobacteria bacterium]|nr:PilT/PilU family type 4a pilus ATPase [Actinomycetota bacterium]
MDLDRLLGQSVEVGASDVHLKVNQFPKLRRDGMLQSVGEWPRLTELDLHAALERVCQYDQAHLRAFTARGDLDIAYTGDNRLRFRVTGFRQRGHTSLAFRLIPGQMPSFQALRLPKGVERLANEQRGLVLVTGPTGAGKSTTLGALVDHINRTRDMHIVTIEDPIEVVHDDHRSLVQQREVGFDTESFRLALRQVLRQDPDVIMIGELRDAESAETAVQAAESGHLVLSSMHTIDAAETVSRLIEFFPETKQKQVRSILAGVLRGVVSQRLLPKVGGGRVPAVEVMIANRRIADLIRDDTSELIGDAIEDGAFFDMRTFEQALIELVVSGSVDQEVAANAATNRHDFLVAVNHAMRTQAASVAAPTKTKPDEESLQALRVARQKGRRSPEERPAVEEPALDGERAS